MNTATTKELTNTPLIIWDSEVRYNEDALKEWWEESYWFNYIEPTKEDVCTLLHLKEDELTSEEKKALEVITSAFVKADREYLPPADIAAWAELCNDDLEDARSCLDKHVNGFIVGFESVNRWNGKGRASILVGSNISSILHSEEDSAKWYALAGDIRGDFGHHDGKNTILYRVLPSEDLARDVAYMWVHCNKTEEEIKKLSSSLYPDVAKVYGWGEV